MKTQNLEKLETILCRISQEEKYHIAALRRTVIVYALLIIIVGAYTTWLAARLEAEITPKNIAVMINTSVRESLPSIRSDAREMMQPAAREIASQTVQSALDLIPAATRMLQTVITDTIDSMFNRLDREKVTPLEESILKSIDDVLARKGMATDPDLAAALSEKVTADLRAELKKVVANDAFTEMANLKTRLKTLLKTPSDQLTRQQQHERMFIVYWLALTEKAPLK